jgi:hypothetical protein
MENYLRALCDFGTDVALIAKKDSAANRPTRSKKGSSLLDLCQ